MVKVIAIGGEPATGKTTLMFKIISMADDWVVAKPEKLLDVMYSDKLRLYILGKYENNDNLFQGTDRLSMAVQPDAERFFSTLEYESNINGSAVNVIFEGDRLFNSKLLDRLSSWFPESFRAYVLTASKDIKNKRHLDRKDNQDEKFKNSRATKISNIKSSLTLLDYVHVVKNESQEDQSEIIKKINSFFNWSK